MYDLTVHIIPIIIITCKMQTIVIITCVISPLPGFPQLYQFRSNLYILSDDYL